METNMETMETDFERMGKTQGAIARERVLRDLQTLARDAEELMKVTAGDLSERVKEARARVGAAVESAKATCNSLREQVVASAGTATRRGDSIIRGNPYASIGMVFGIGVLIGVLVGRR